MHQKQRNLAFAQLMVDLPNFILVLVLAILSNTMIVWMDVLDSLGYVLRCGIVIQVSKKLIRDLRYEYNYGSGKVETMVAMLCDGIIFGGLIMMVGICFYHLRHPSGPSDAVLGAVLLKAVILLLDIAFLWQQKKIMKEKGGAIAQSNYASYMGALLFDTTALLSLVVAWLLRDNPAGWYFSPVVSILLALFLMYQCLKRFAAAVNVLTDKTLPEEMQMKILKVMTGFYDRYAQLHFVKSRRSADAVEIDIVLSFEADTSYGQIQKLKQQLQEEMDKFIDNCTVNLSIC